jgi:putative SOS response-associated peptidase YedK
MPLIIAPEDCAAWLDPQKRDVAELKALVRPYPGERMRARPVSPRVSAPENDDPALIEPLAGGPAQADLL